MRCALTRLQQRQQQERQQQEQGQQQQEQRQQQQQEPKQQGQQQQQQAIQHQHQQQASRPGTASRSGDGDCLLVVAGDFNSSRDDSVWRLLYRSRLDAGTTEAWLPSVAVTRHTIAHPYRLHDVYCAAGFELPFTRKGPRHGSATHAASTVDYIFASTAFDVAAVHYPLSVRWSNTARLARLSLPNATHASDHLPVGCVLRLHQPSAVARRATATAEAAEAEAAAAWEAERRHAAAATAEAAAAQEQQQAKQQAKRVLVGV
ncbi:hypothetical protein FOA52_010351 [Chlamydomonas sp. UWO 241]|nr:hypothetical protein FOA52_010351 [Chlamydomonas sp. UWO 241]